jgi:TonB family protein
MKTVAGVTPVVISLLLLAAPAGAADEVSTARELYAAAAYDDALGMLNRLRAERQTPENQLLIDQYRAYCLLALGRAADAEQAIEAVVTAAPQFVPSNADVSPRIRLAFSDVRKKLLPVIIQDRYARGKAAYDRKDFITASTEFKQVLTSLADPDVGSAAGRPPLSDIKTLAGAFFELSFAALAPPPLPPPPPQPIQPLPVPATIPAPAPVVAKRTTPYGPDDPGVVPPAVVKQRLPDLDAKVAVDARNGVLEVVINENGDVETAALRVPVHPRYDQLVLEAARGWRYKPATVDGKPVKYRKVITISVKLG